MTLLEIRSLLLLIRCLSSNCQQLSNILASTVSRTCSRENAENKRIKLDRDHKLKLPVTVHRTNFQGAFSRLRLISGLGLLFVSSEHIRRDLRTQDGIACR